VKLRFQADADLNHAMVTGLERRFQDIDSNLQMPFH